MPHKVKKQKAEAGEELLTRQFSLRREPDGRPSSLNREARTVEVIATTEDPVPVYDWEYGTIGEVLLMSGLKLPATRQVPLQDTHDRYSVKATLGSARNLRVEGDAAAATVHFSTVREAEDTMIKVEEGHITDFSVGWRQHKAVRIPKNESQVIGGREFKGPLRVVTSWAIKELSIVPIGADERAKARSASAYLNMEESNMKEKIRKLLESLGLKADASEEDAWKFFEARGGNREMSDDEAENFLRSLDPAGGRAQGPASAAAAAPDVRAVSIEAARTEMVRQNKIRKLCEEHGCQELSDGLIEGGRTVDQAAAAILEHARTMNNTRLAPIPAGDVAFGQEGRDKFRAAVVYCMVVDQAGYTMKNAKEAPGHEDFRAYSLPDLARECLRNAGRPTGGNILDMITRALTSSDLPNILGEVADYSLQSGFDLNEETYDLWTDSIPASDFKAMNLVSVSNLDDLDTIKENGEYKYGYFKDAKEMVTLGKGGKIYPITMEVLVNDDKNAVTAVFFAAGQKARKYEGDLVYALLTGNPTMNEDSRALFDTAGGTVYHDNQGTGGLPDTDTLNEFNTLLGRRTGINGEPLNIRLAYVIAPRAIEGYSESFFSTVQFLTDSLMQNNIWGGNRLTRVYESRLDANSVKTWYGAAKKGTTIVRTHLNGVKTPYIERREGWTTDGIELKVRFPVAAGIRSWRGLLRNPGRT